MVLFASSGDKKKQQAVESSLEKSTLLYEVKKMTNLNGLLSTWRRGNRGLKEESSSGRFHVVALARDDPLELAQLGVEGALLQRPKPESESGPELSKLHLLRRFELVPGQKEK